MKAFPSHRSSRSSGFVSKASRLGRCSVATGLLSLATGEIVVAATDPAGASTEVRLTANATLPSDSALECFKIETNVATYYLEKSGAGLAALIDRNGNDWIGFRPDPGSRSAGEFRGFPNAVHQQGGSFFHPMNQNTGESTTKVEQIETGHVAISATSSNGLWACRYDFFPNRCTFTMTRMSPEHKYWILYEGTPGGELDETDWWMTSDVRRPQSVMSNHEGDIPDPEWIVFGDANRDRVIFLLHHADDSHPDRFYQARGEMTVLGFGRRGGEKHLSSVPHSVSIGLLETTDPAVIDREMTKIQARQ
ncbi:MAG: hypothetical protein ACREIA_26275 [Opitutaceae bacterium]